MERKTYFSLGEMVGYFLLLIVGLNLVVAIPVIIKIYPVLLENFEKLGDTDFMLTYFVNDILIANIGWQILSLITLLFILKKKGIELGQYFKLNEYLNRNNFALVFMVFVIMLIILNPASEYFDVPPNPTMEYLLENGNFYLIIITTIIAAPIVEEVIFRGWIFNEFENRYSRIVAIHVSSILFTIIHIQYDIAEMILVLIIAYSLALLRVKTKNLIFPILLHFLNNTGALIEFFAVYK